MKYETTVRVYADLQAHHLLAEELGNLMVTDEWTDLNDGDDNWEPLLERVEQRFGTAWSLVVVFQGFLLGRCFTRRRYVLGEQDFEPPLAVGRRLYLYGCNDLDAVSSLFAGSICYEVTPLDAAPYTWHINGRDENIIKTFMPLLNEKISDPRKCIVVRNPDERSKLSFMKLQERYECGVWINDDHEFSEIRSLSRAFLVAPMLESVVSRAQVVVDYYNLRRPSYVKSLSQTIKEENDDIMSEFFQRFCV